VIHNHLERNGDGTKVTAITELSVTGRQAQFGRGVMQDVATTMMQEFATRLERELQVNGGPPPAGDHAEPAPLDVGGVLLRTGLLRHAAAAIGALALVVAIVTLVGRPRRRRLKLELVLDR
jgi:hypothetical protein